MSDAVEDLTKLSHIEHSGSMELMIESLFLSEVLQEAWFGRARIVDVLHSTVDAFGYDVVFQCGDVVRHVQVKAKKRGTRTSRYAISVALTEQPAGCVVCVIWERVPGLNRVRLSYKWLGNAPHESLGDLGGQVSKQSRGNSLGVKGERKNMRDVKLSAFTDLAGASELVDRLFGPVG